MTHRGTIAFCVACLVVLLLVQGFTTKTIGAAGTVDTVSAAAPLAHSRPILGPGPRGLVSHEPGPGRRVWGRASMPGRLWLAGVAAAVLAAAAIAVATAGTPRRAPPAVTRSPAAVAARDGAYVRVDQLAVAGGATVRVGVLLAGA